MAMHRRFCGPTMPWLPVLCRSWEPTCGSTLRQGSWSGWSACWRPCRSSPPRSCTLRAVSRSPAVLVTIRCGPLLLLCNVLHAWLISVHELLPPLHPCLLPCFCPAACQGMPEGEETFFRHLTNLRSLELGERGS